jgi:alkyldihydroxyacetonephosphate synthase
MIDFKRKLTAVIDPRWVLTEPSQLDELSWDALSEGRIHPERRPLTTLPRCAVLPASTTEVSGIVAIANEEKIPIIPYGGGSGLMGAALSLNPAIILDLRRMSRLLQVDKASRFAQVQAGIVLEALDVKLNKTGCILGHDPWTLPVATIGGAISTNSVGYRAGVYGSMGDQVLGLEAVMPDGSILRTRSVPKSSTGLDLNALLIGGEGCFGIITEASIKIFPQPERRLLHGIVFDSFERGFEAIELLFAKSLRPALLDYGDGEGKCNGDAVLYLGFEGTKEIVDAEDSLALSILIAKGGAELPSEHVERFWRERHEIARRFMVNRRQRRDRGLDGVYRDWIHVALPASKVLSFRSQAIAMIEQRGVHLDESGLWIQPELFSMRLGIEDKDAGNGRLILQQTIDELLRLAQRLDGSMEYTHGVGIKLASLMSEEHGHGLEIMRRIKRMLDPNNIMNPGKMGL